LIRRVVTAEIDGKSVIVSDGILGFRPLALVPPGTEFFRLWGEDYTPQLPNEGTQPEQPTYFPSTGGYRFLAITFAPDTVQTGPIADMEAALAEFEAAMPRFTESVCPENPAMHQTDTVDLDIILSGEVWLEMDDGKEVLLRAGDCVIQNGTRHAWHNRSSEPCRMIAAVIGGTRTRNDAHVH
jgi:mannose-6-phosphate isomerase-like protein (cupin superfamily)